MADLVPVPASMAVYEDAVFRRFKGGEAIEAGMSFYLKSSDGKAYKAVSSSAAAADATGIAICPCPAADDYFIAVVSGGVDLGVALTVGESYFVSGASGKVQPSADVGSGEYVTELGKAVTSSRLKLNVIASGVAHA